MTTATPTRAAATTRDVAAKLHIRPGSTLWLSDSALLPALGRLPEGVATLDAPAAAETAILVARDRASLDALLRRHRDALVGPGACWVAYPKKDRVDLHRDTVWPVLVEHELRPIGQASIGDEWSAMRFRALAPGEPPFTGGR